MNDWKYTLAITGFTLLTMLGVVLVATGHIQ